MVLQAVSQTQAFLYTSLLLQLYPNRDSPLAYSEEYEVYGPSVAEGVWPLFSSNIGSL